MDLFWIVCLACVLWLIYELVSLVRRYQTQQATYAHIPYVKQIVPQSAIMLNFLPGFLKKRVYTRDFSFVDLPALFEERNTNALAFVSSGRTIVYINDPKLVKEACISKKLTIHKPTYMYGVLNLFGENIVTANDGADWKRHRVAANPAFGEANNRLVAQSTVRNFHLMCEKWESQDRIVNAHDDMTRLTLSVICEAGFGQSFNIFTETEDKRPSGFELSFREVMEVVSNHNLAKLILPNFVFKIWRSKFLRLVDTGFKEFTQYAEQFIEERKHKQDNSASDLLTLLLNDSSMSNNDLISNTFMFLIAGHETTAHTLEFLLGELSKRPDIQQKICDEFTEVMAGCPESDYYSRFSQLVWAKASFEETLRRYPPVPMVPKWATEDLYLGEYFLPARTEIGISVMSMHKSPKLWPEPEEFRPERFLPVSIDPASGPKYSYDPYAFAPFSLGQRSCIGRKVAYVEAILTVGLLCQKYKITPKEVNMKDVVNIITLAPLHPVKVCLEPR